MATLQCLVVTPESTALDATAEFVALPLYDGEIGIAPGHSPMIGRLGYGEMRLKTPDGEKKYYVDGGFVQVADNVVSVLTNKAMPAAAIKIDEAEKLLADATNKPANSDELLAIRDRQIAQARAQIRAGKRAR
jgi:F-type H+-transporting ATPase subunit epsilon